MSKGEQMALKNKTMYAILGILNIASGTGYDIKKYCDTVIPGIWNENYGHIYPTLRAMTEEGLIEVQDQTEETSRIQYSITPSGRTELLSWLKSETGIQPGRSEFMLKLLFADRLPREDVRAMIAAYRALHEETLQKYRRMERDLLNGIKEIGETRVPYLLSVLRSGIYSAEATLAWCDETTARFT